MLRWTQHRFNRLLLCLGTAAVLYAGAGCGHSASDVAATVSGSQKKADGEPCAKDSDCVNVCLTASEAEKTPTLQPNTCGKTNRVNPS